MTAVLFDLDGTLIDSLPNIAAAANAVLRRHELPALEARVVAGFVGHGEAVFVDRLIAATELEAERRDEVMALFLRHYKEEARHTQLMHGAGKALESLKEAGVPLGLVTNKPRGPLEATLMAGGLADVFDVVLAGDDLPRRKPDPLPLTHAMGLLGVEQCIYVGDSEVDAATARAAGVPFVLYTEGIRSVPVHDIPHDVAFTDFGMLPALLERLIEPGQDSAS